MSTLNAQNTQVTEPPILARVRAEHKASIAEHPAQAEVWNAFPAAVQEKLLLEKAVLHAIFASPVGQIAARVDTAIAELLNALGAMLEAYPDDDAFRDAATHAAAVEGLALTHVPSNSIGNFAGIIQEARGWFFVVNHMADMLRELEPPCPLPDAVDEAEEPSAVNAIEESAQPPAEQEDLTRA